MNSMSEDSIQERVVNNILLMYLIQKANSVGKVEDNLKLQKLVFLGQKKMIERKIKAFSYNFFRWDKGPFSAEVNNDLTSLASRGLVSYHRPIEVTEEGKKLLEDFEELFQRNRHFIEVINEILSIYATYTPEEIKAHVYNMNIFVPRLRRVMTIAEVPRGTLILFKPSDKTSKKKFSLDEAWCTTLELVLDQEAVESLRQAYDDAKEGRVHEFRTL